MRPWESEPAAGAARHTDTRPAGPPAAEPAWTHPLLKLWRRPQKPSLADALARLPAEPPEGIAPPSYGQAKRYLNRMSAVERARGRLGPNAIKAVRAFTRRTFDRMRAGDTWICDGHSGDLECLHPQGGQACRPEITCVLDIASRLWCGTSVALAESSWAVADCLRDGIDRHGVPAIWYSDRGSGQQSAVMDGILQRLGVTRERAIAATAKRGASQNLSING